MLVFEYLELSIAMADCRIFMSRIDRRQLAGRKFQNAQPDGDKHICFISLTDCLIDIRQNLGRRPAHPGSVGNHDIHDHHEQGGRNTFSGYIAHHHNQVILINQEEIIKIAANLLSRIHRSINVKLRPVRKSRELIGNGVLLNVAGQTQLCSDSLFLRCNRSQIIDIIDHVLFHGVNGIRQIGNL